MRALKLRENKEFDQSRRATKGRAGIRIQVTPSPADCPPVHAASQPTHSTGRPVLKPSPGRQLRGTGHRGLGQCQWSGGWVRGMGWERFPLPGVTLSKGRGITWPQRAPTSRAREPVPHGSFLRASREPCAHPPHAPAFQQNLP